VHFAFHHQFKKNLYPRRSLTALKVVRLTAPPIIAMPRHTFGNFPDFFPAVSAGGAVVAGGLTRAPPPDIFLNKVAEPTFECPLRVSVTLRARPRKEVPRPL